MSEKKKALTPAQEVVKTVTAEVAKRIKDSVYQNAGQYLRLFEAALFTNAKILLLSDPGKGKTVIAKLISQAFGVTMGRVQGEPGLQASMFVASYKLGALQRGEEEVIWRNFVKATIKHFDEINRVPAHVLSSIFSLLAGEEVFFGQECTMPAEGPFIGTMNPRDAGNFEMPRPFYDRFDLCLVPPSISSFDMEALLMNEAECRAPMPQVAKPEDLAIIRDEIAQIPVSADALTWLTVAVRSTSICMHGEKEMLKNFPQSCANCDIGKGSAVCNFVTPLSYRAAESGLKIARGLAYLDGAKEVRVAHIMEALPAVIRHRVTFAHGTDEVHNDKEIEQLLRRIDGAVKDVVEVRKKPGGYTQKELRDLTKMKNPLVEEEIRRLMKTSLVSAKSVADMTVDELLRLVEERTGSDADIAKAQKILEKMVEIRIYGSTTEIQAMEYWPKVTTPEGDMILSQSGWEFLLCWGECSSEQIVAGVTARLEKPSMQEHIIVLTYADVRQAEIAREHLAAQGCEILPLFDEEDEAAATPA